MNSASVLKTIGGESDISREAVKEVGVMREEEKQGVVQMRRE